MEREFTLVEHLNELRKRIIISLVALGAGIIVSLPFASLCLKVIKLPVSGSIEKLAFFSPQEAFLIYMRLAFSCGFVIAMPVILCQLWAFIAPAVEKRLKRNISYFIFFGFSAFIVGGLFAYFILIPPALKFLLGFAKEDLVPIISADKYISFVTGLILSCGLVFQMPILSIVLSKLGIINARYLRSKYKYALIIIFIAAAVITPTPDAFDMFMLVLPMLFLYELSIWLCFFFKPKTIRKIGIDTYFPK